MGFALGPPATDVAPGNRTRMNERPHSASLACGLHNGTHQALGGADTASSKPLSF